MNTHNICLTINWPIIPYIELKIWSQVLFTSNVDDKEILLPVGFCLVDLFSIAVTNRVFHIKYALSSSSYIVLVVNRTWA
jgi:hypothetical protein